MVGNKKRKLAILVPKQGGKCCYCGMSNCNFTIEHKIPTAWGGSNKIENLAAACVDCNYLADAAFNALPWVRRRMLVDSTPEGEFMKIDIFNPDGPYKKHAKRALKLRSKLEERYDRISHFHKRLVMKTILVFLFLSSSAFAQDYVCKMTNVMRRWTDENGNQMAQQQQWSGVAISDILILSVAHSITKGEAKAEFAGQTVTAEVVKYDEVRDLALFKSKVKIKAAPARIASRHPVLARVIGFASGERRVVSYPVSPIKAWVIESEPLLIMDGQPYHGMSGGAVLNEEGELVGIQSSGDFNSRRVMASSLSQVRAFLRGELR